MKNIKAYLNAERISKTNHIVQDGAVITWTGDDGDEHKEFVQFDNEEEKVFFNNWLRENKDGGSDFIYDEVLSNLCVEDFNEADYTYRVDDEADLNSIEHKDFMKGKIFLDLASGNNYRIDSEYDKTRKAYWCTEVILNDDGEVEEELSSGWQTKNEVEKYL